MVDDVDGIFCAGVSPYKSDKIENYDIQDVQDKYRLLENLNLNLMSQIPI